MSVSPSAGVWLPSFDVDLTHKAPSKCVAGDILKLILLFF